MKPVKFSEFRISPKKYLVNDGVFWIAKKGKRKRCYYKLYCGFDIETYTEPIEHHAYMYIWQFSIYGTEEIIIYGRTWSEFVEFIGILKKVLELTKECRLIVFVFNFSYEFQFVKNWLSWSDMFAREIRKPLYAIHDDCIEFRDAQAITGGSLELLAKNYTSTQKAVGDLDYTIPRNYKTQLTDAELGYCLADVAILAEFSKYVFETYIIPEKYIPMTKTGLLRRQVKNAIGKKYSVYQEIYRCYPDDYGLYQNLMKWCFRGGYTHGNLYHAGRVIEGLHARDITSSYPYVMLASDGFPVSPLKRENPIDFEKLLLGERHCLMFRAVFINIRSKTNHSYESSSKCVSIGGALLDNGRIRRASVIDVWLTERDYYLYLRFYEWDSMTITYLYSSLRGRLPKYLIMPLAEAYKKKAEMKQQGLSDTPEYANYKSLVNSAYGMTVTKLQIGEIKLDIANNWVVDYKNFDYEEERKKAFLLPQWGIYVCALARERICNAILACGNDSVYSDTDSIKYLGDHETLFGMINAETEKTMTDVCNRYSLPFEYFSDLGTFEQEYGGRAVKGKFLGAKRYIITDQDKTIVTIAGLPKGSLQAYCASHEKDIYEVFNNGMLMDIEISMKNAHCYNDKAHSDIIDGELCAELSSVGIYPIEFTMKLDEYYLHLINNIKEGNLSNEERIY